MISCLNVRLHGGFSRQGQGCMQLRIVDSKIKLRIAASEIKLKIKLNIRNLKNNKKIPGWGSGRG